MSFAADSAHGSPHDVRRTVSRKGHGRRYGLRKCAGCGEQDPVARDVRSLASPRRDGRVAGRVGANGGRKGPPTPSEERASSPDPVSPEGRSSAVASLHDIRRSPRSWRCHRPTVSVGQGGGGNVGAIYQMPRRIFAVKNPAAGPMTAAVLGWVALRRNENELGTSAEGRHPGHYGPCTAYTPRDGRHEGVARDLLRSLPGDAHRSQPAGNPCRQGPGGHPGRSAEVPLRRVWTARDTVGHPASGRGKAQDAPLAAGCVDRDLAICRPTYMRGGYRQTVGPTLCLTGHGLTRPTAKTLGQPERHQGDHPA